MPKTLPAVAYIRMSTAAQDESPAQQRERIARLAEQHNCTIIREYVDEAISGTTGKRTQFQKMIRDAQQKDFKAILLWDLARFSRQDSLDAAEWVTPLRRAGIKLITNTGVISMKPEKKSAELSAGRGFASPRHGLTSWWKRQTARPMLCDGYSKRMPTAT